MLFEVCVDSVASALAAAQGGAQRLELCANLVEGGTTPSLGMIRRVRERAAAPGALDLMVIIRPRGGDFLYTPDEFAVMQADLLAAKDAGANGVVLGILTPDGCVDAARTAALVRLAAPLPVTFHRAVDLCRDPLEALETLAELGVARVLTSGGWPTAMEGAPVIAQMVARAGVRLSVMAGGGVSAENIAALAAATGVREVHFSARESLPSAMQFRAPGIFMGRAYQPDEYALRGTRAEAVRAVIRAWECSTISHHGGSKQL